MTINVTATLKNYVTGGALLIDGVEWTVRRAFVLALNNIPQSAAGDGSQLSRLAARKADVFSLIVRIVDHDDVEVSASEKETLREAAATMRTDICGQLLQVLESQPCNSEKPSAAP